MLAGFTNDLRYVDIAHQALAQMQPMMGQYPSGFGQWLQALGCALSRPREIGIIGDPQAADTQALLNVVRDGYRPFQVVAPGSPDGGNGAVGVRSIAAVPLLQDRVQVDGQATAYVCDAPSGRCHPTPPITRFRANKTAFDAKMTPKAQSIPKSAKGSDSWAWALLGRFELSTGDGLPDEMNPRFCWKIHSRVRARPAGR